jgi:uncharacterized protein
MEARRSAPSGKPIVPVFPLPNVLLFPGCLLQLHVFEPRYRQMIEDLLDRPGRLVMGTILDGELADNGQMAIYPVAGLGDIGRHERLADGRFLIWLMGVGRVVIHETVSDRLYRKVEYEPLIEIPVDAGCERSVRTRVHAALVERCADFSSLPSDLPLTQLIDLLMQRVPMPPSRLRELFGEPDLEERAEGVLHECKRRPKQPPKCP